MQERRSRSSIYLLVLLLFFNLSQHGSAREFYGVSQQIRLLESTPNHLILEFDASLAVRPPNPPPDKTRKAMLAIPPGGLPSVSILSATYSEKRADHLREGLVEPDFENYVSRIVQIKPLGTCRQLRLAELAVRPSHKVYHATTSWERQYQYLKVGIHFSETESSLNSRQRPVGGSEDPIDFDRLFSKILLNAPVPASFRIHPSTSPPIPVHPDLPKGIQGPVAKILIRGEGFFRISLGDIGRFFDREIPASQVCFYDEGQVMPVWVDTGTWKGGPSFVFYSKDRSPYSATNVVWVSVVDEEIPGSRLHRLALAQDTIPQATGRYTVRHEEDMTFSPAGDKSSKQASDWFWGPVSEKDPFEATLPLPDLDSAAKEIDISLRCATPSDKFKRKQAPKDYNYSLAGTKVEFASFTTHRSKDEPDKFWLGYRLKLSEKLRAALIQGATLDVRIEKSKPYPSRKAKPLFPYYVDAIKLDYTHRLTLRDGNLRFPLNPHGRGPWEIRIPRSEQDLGVPFLAFGQGKLFPERVLEVRKSQDGKELTVAGIPLDLTHEMHHIQVVNSANIETVTPIQPRLSTRLLDPGNQADSLFVSYPDFVKPSERLIRYHEDRGYSTFVATTEEIYDTFGDGTTSPETIKNFLQYVFRHWKRPSPTFLVLVGDATWDYKGRFGNGIINFVPSIREGTKYPSDHYYVCLEGDDKLPEVFVGRVSVHDATTCRTVAEKIAGEYAPKGPWIARVLAFADKEKEFNQEFKQMFSGGYFPHGFRTEFMSLRQFPFQDNYYHPEDLMLKEKTKYSAECNQAIIDSIDRGMFLWDFHGHGAPNVLGHERIFFGGGSKYSDVKELRNRRKFPLFIANTCDTARFDYAQEKWNISLGEDLLHHPQGGCIAAFLHTGRGFPVDHRVIDRFFLDSIFRYRLKAVGEILHAGKILYYLNANRDGPVTMMVLIGDPSTPLPYPEQDLSVAVTPDSIVRRPGAVQSLILEALPETKGLVSTVRKNQYLGYMYVTNSEKRVVWEMEELPLEDGRLRARAEFSIPDDAENGRWYAGAYIYPASPGMSPFLPDAVGGTTFNVESDPSILEDLKARVQENGRPDLRIAGIVIEPTEPIDGHTVWIHAEIVNDGTGVAEEFDVSGYDGKRSRKNRVKSRNGDNKNRWTVEALYPGESRVVHMRWDPFDNPGRRILTIEVNPNRRVKESDSSNNSATCEIYVKTKADLLIQDTAKDIVFAKDKETGALQVTLVVQNIGECPVEQEFRILVYSYKTDDPDQELIVTVEPCLRENGWIPIGPERFYPMRRHTLPEGTVRV